MNVLNETYIFYADVYFLQNFLIKVAVIYLSLYVNKIYLQIATMKRIGKIVGVSCLGTLIEIIGLLCVGSYNLFILLVHLVEIPFMTWLILGKQRQQMLKVIIAGYFFVMVINGILEILWNCFGEEGNYIFYLLVACGIAFAGLRIWQRRQKEKKGVFTVEIIHNDKCISTYGFYDSGNHLIDPYSGKGVHIISARLLEKLVSTQDKKVCIPYQALGKMDGLLDVYYIQCVKIHGKENITELQIVPVGVTEDNLFEGKKYEMILNEEVF